MFVWNTNLACPGNNQHCHNSNNMFNYYCWFAATSTFSSALASAQQQWCHWFSKFIDIFSPYTTNNECCAQKTMNAIPPITTTLPLIALIVRDEMWGNKFDFGMADTSSTVQPHINQNALVGSDMMMMMMATTMRATTTLAMLSGAMPPDLMTKQHHAWSCAPIVHPEPKHACCCCAIHHYEQTGTPIPLHCFWLWKWIVVECIYIYEAVDGTKTDWLTLKLLSNFPRVHLLACAVQSHTCPHLSSKACKIRSMCQFYNQSLPLPHQISAYDNCTWGKWFPKLHHHHPQLKAGGCAFVVSIAASANWRQHTMKQKRQQSKRDSNELQKREVTQCKIERSLPCNPKMNTIMQCKRDRQDATQQRLLQCKRELWCKKRGHHNTKENITQKHECCDAK